MTARIRMAFLGCGSFARRHAETLVTLPEQVSLVAFCNRTPEKAANFSQVYSGGAAGVYGDFDRMLTEVSFDALVVTLPPYAHEGQIEKAAARGIHLFVEKPIALESGRAWRMVEAVESAGVRSQVGFMFRFGEAVETLKSMLDDGSAGPAGLMTARYFCNALHAPWWRDRDKSGGQLVEQVIHLIDLMRCFMGDPIAVFSRQENLFHRDVPGYSIEDVSGTVFGFPSGGIGLIAATNGAIPNRWESDFRLVTQNLTADFSHANRATITFTAGPARPPLEIQSERNIHLAEMLDFLEAIRQNRPARIPMREGAKSLDAALAARRSAETRKEIVLKWR